MNNLNHVAFIMDGNGRWGDSKGKNRNYGHFKGLETVKEIVKCSIIFQIPIVTFYVFSSENWKRPRSEIKYLFRLINDYFSKEISGVIKQGIKLNIFGEFKELPNDVKKTLKKSINLTQNNKKIIVNLGINYGSKDEIVSAIKKNKKKISIKNIENNLFLSKLPNPDILIRTGGYQRLSNFMLWQLAYTELFFLKKMWPDFNSKDLKKILNKYSKIKRNFGAI